MQKAIKGLILFMCLLCSSFSFSKDKELESLLYKLKTAKSDSVRIKALSELSDYYSETGEINLGISYGYRALNFAIKKNHPQLTASCYMNLGHAYSHSNKQIALSMFIKSLKIYRKLGDKLSMADAYVNIGNRHADRSDYANSIRCHLYAYNYAKRVNDLDLLADVSVNLGLTFHTIGNYPEALKMQFQALKLYEKMRYEQETANCYNSLGNIYADQEKKEKALKMYRLSLKQSLKINDKLGIGNATVNIGIVYSELAQYESANEMFLKAIAIFNELQDSEGIAICYNSIGKNNLEQKKIDEAIKALNTSLQISLFTGDVIEASTSKIFLGQVYLQQHKLKEAGELFNASKISCKAIGYKLGLKDAYKCLYQLDSASHNYASAFENHKQYIAYRDIINNEETELKSVHTSLNYEFEKKASEQARKHEKAIDRLESTNKLSGQRQLFLVVLVLVLLAAGGIIFYFVRRTIAARRSYYQIVANENEHKEILLQEVHHRVNNSLQMISSLLSIQADTAENEEIKAYLFKSENRIQAMSVMHQLLHLGNSKLEVNMEEYLGEVLSFYSSLLESKPGINIYADIPPVMFHTKYAMPIALILNELITNSLKYAFPDDKGRITLSLSKDKSNTWTFSMSDNGIGFNTDSESFSTSSIGLSLVGLMTRQIGGKIELTGSGGMNVVIVFEEDRDTKRVNSSISVKFPAEIAEYHTKKSAENEPQKAQKNQDNNSLLSFVFSCIFWLFI